MNDLAFSVCGTAFLEKPASRSTELLFPLPFYPRQLFILITLPLLSWWFFCFYGTLPKEFAVTQNFLLFLKKLTKYYLNVTSSETLNVEISVVDFKGCH